MIECVDKVILFISSSLTYMTYLVIALVVCKLLISNRASSLPEIVTAVLGCFINVS